MPEKSENKIVPKKNNTNNSKTLTTTNKKLTSKSKVITTRKPKKVQPIRQDIIDIGALAKLAISKDNAMEIIERLTTLYNQQEDRACKKEFDKHFSEMQKQFKPIDKSKQGFEFKYAELGEMIYMFGPIISDHGFSYRWSEEELKDKEGWKRITIHISGYGHTDSNTHFDCPEYELKGKQVDRVNAIQKEGTKTSYGHRYTFKAGFGIVEIGEDTDGEYRFDDITKYYEEIQQIEACTNPEQVNAVAKSIYDKLVKANDQYGGKIIRKAYAKRKSELSQKQEK